MKSVGVLLVALWITGCGVMGPPVPPNSIGVNVKRENDKRLERERVLLEAKANKEADFQQLPQDSDDQATNSLESRRLQDQVVDPAARPNDDFLVRPR